MSVLAYDGTTLAADRQATASGFPFSVRKIHMIESPRKLIFGVCGAAVNIPSFGEWLAAGAVKDEFAKLNVKDDFVALVIHEDDRKILRYENSPFPIEVLEDFHAVGSGRDMALTAMYLGKSAKTAVEVACVFDVDCGRGVDVLTF